VIDALPTTTTYTPTSALNAGTTYYWEVHGRSSTQYGTWSTIFSFTTAAGNLPAPVLSTPPNGSTGQSTQPGFSWSPVTGANDGYRILVASSAADLPTDPTATSGGPSVVIDALPTTTTYTPTSALNAGTTYYWEVHGRSSTQYGTWSTIFSFTTAAANLPAPVLSTPPNGSTSQSTNPGFSWSPVTGANDGYRILVATSAGDLPTDPTATSGGPSVVIDALPTTTTYTPTSALNAGTTYYWEVHGRSTTQYGTWSTIFSFTTAAGNLPAPVLSTPPNGSTGQSTTPGFSWSPVTGANDGYRILVATSAADLPTDPTATSEGPSVVNDALPTTTTYTPTSALNAGTTYYWEVHGRSSTQYGTWSTIFSFTTAAANLPAPVLSTPPNGSTSQSTNPGFSWSNVTGANDGYRILVATSAGDLPTDPTATSG